MRILLTNDDGIYAPGIYAVYKELIKFADVLVVAPQSEQSSVGHGITLYHPLFAQQVHRKDKLFGYAISGKPADCVKFAIDVVLKGKKPDLVISGINFGGNDGCSVFYSGTVAGAREGCLIGIDAFAVSLDCYQDPNFTQAAKFSAKLAKWVYKNKLPKGTFLNVNVPKQKARGVKWTRQGIEPIHGTFTHRKSPYEKSYYWMGGQMPKHKNDNSIDTYALGNHYITITPVHCDLTDTEFLKVPKSL